MIHYKKILDEGTFRTILIILSGEDINFVKEKANPFDVSSLLKQYFRELPEPLLLPVGSKVSFTRWIEIQGIKPCFSR
jgi:hypothetical protein